MRALLIAGILIAGLPVSAEDEPVPTFALCPDNIATAELRELETTSQWGLLVRLTGPGSEAFEAFTTQHVGQKIRVVSPGDRPLIEPVVRAPIVSGLLQLTGFEDESAAKAALARLREETSRCGAGPG